MDTAALAELEERVTFHGKLNAAYAEIKRPESIMASRHAMDAVVFSKDQFEGKLVAFTVYSHHNFACLIKN